LSKRVLVADHAWPSLEIERRVLSAVNADVVVADKSDEAFLRQARTADAIATNWRIIPPTLLECATRCRTVARYGVGVDNIPVKKATELGMVVSNVPDYCVDEVATHTLALVLASARQIVASARLTRTGEWIRPPVERLRRTTELTVGVVGFGRIGRLVAAKARAIGFGVIAYRRGPATGLEDSDGVFVPRAQDLESLLEVSDFVSLHLPLTDATRSIIGDGEFRRMKPSAYLINTARGDLVDQAALERALNEGQIAGAAVDVLSREPPDPADPLLSCEGLVVTPHSAFFSKESVVELERRTAEHIVAVFEGQVPSFVVNPQVLVQDNCRLGLPW
jgi:D-3-phosphoglycerate dehydrogenase